MTETSRTATGRKLSDPATAIREARRMVGLQRHYRCGCCGTERDSWSRLSRCHECGEAYVAAVIRRAAFA